MPVRDAGVLLRQVSDGAWLHVRGCLGLGQLGHSSPAPEGSGQETPGEGEVEHGTSKGRGKEKEEVEEGRILQEERSRAGG